MPSPTFAEVVGHCIIMRGIKVGNMLVFRNSAVCIINEIIKEEGNEILVGTDCNNVEHRGPKEDWKSVMRFKDKLLLFEDKIFCNIVGGR